MRHRLVAVWLGLLVGCQLSETPTALLPANLFAPPPPVPSVARTAFPPAPVEAAARVDTLGRSILAANPQLGVRPVFRTIGAAQPEIFHIGTTEVDLTEGLVNQCATEGQLAAVLCHELGKMVAEREALAGPQARQQEPPMEVRVGNDSGGRFGAADGTHLAELGNYEKKHPRQVRQVPPPPPNPQALARGYLVKAGYTAADLDAVTSLLQTAAENNTFAKQLVPPAREKE